MEINSIEMNRPTWVEIDLGKIKKNFEVIENLTNKRKVICVVKADAYGLGAHKIAKELESSGAFAFAVASMEEALDLRTNNINKPILVLGYVDTRNLNLASESNIRITLFDRDFIKRLKGYTLEKTLNIHIKVDTGMHRLGVNPEDVLSIFEEVSQFKNIFIEGIYTHFASADSDSEYTEFQIGKFNNVLQQLRSKRMLPPVVHAANSAAILNVDDTYYNAVRPGILLYGISPNLNLVLPHQFSPAVSMKTRIIKVSYYSKGERISYGGTYILDSDRVIATVPIGYADGIPRSLSNRGYVLVKEEEQKLLVL